LGGGGRRKKLGRERGREADREGERLGGREGNREGEREGGREEGRQAGRLGEREGSEGIHQHRLQRDAHDMYTHKYTHQRKQAGTNSNGDGVSGKKRLTQSANPNRPSLLLPHTYRRASSLVTHKECRLYPPPRQNITSDLVIISRMSACSHKGCQREAAAFVSANFVCGVRDLRFSEKIIDEEER